MDKVDLRAAMGRFATGVAVVTAADGAGRPFGSTANAVSSVSLDPPLVLVCLRRESDTLAAIRTGRRFAVNVLREEHRATADRFAARARHDTWDDVTARWAEGLPLIDGALATVECVVHELADGGDHVIVIGRVVAVDHRHDGDPLLFFGGRYAALDPEPPAAAPPGPEIALPSALGALRMVALPDGGTVEASVAVLVGEPHGTEGALLYLHRGCLLGDALGSEACGSRARLHAAVRDLEAAGRPGVVVYHRDSAVGFGGCCLGGDAAPTTDSERAAVREAIARLRLRDPVVLEPVAA
jgi:flavin reductase (DIM6/NTAB) family NADH-FMN oxidoreductase RutF